MPVPRCVESEPRRMGRQACPRAELPLHQDPAMCPVPTVSPNVEAHLAPTSPPVPTANNTDSRATRIAHISTSPAVLADRQQNGAGCMAPPNLIHQDRGRRLLEASNADRSKRTLAPSPSIECRSHPSLRQGCWLHMGKGSSGSPRTRSDPCSQTSPIPHHSTGSDRNTARSRGRVRGRCRG